ncbi:hypothetical protein RIVM261_004070 [Rivularia sp. IAM M-261]|nr:hypothetical protein RIVM261_004070 [Rivularia sp. IAM M-261]
MIPLILGAAALATGAVGVTKGAEGIGKIKQASCIGEDAQLRYERHLRELEVVWENTNKSAETYGQIQLRIKQSTVSRFIAFIELLRNLLVYHLFVLRLMTQTTNGHFKHVGFEINLKLIPLNSS